MRLPVTVLLAPALLLISACSTHYAASGHHGYGHGRGHGQVSVGVHGRSHGHAGAVVGALVVGAVVGHLLTDAANKKQRSGQVSSSTSSRDHVASPEDELVNGYPIRKQQTQVLEKNIEQNKFYQLGKDGNCYLMENKGEEVIIISMVPAYSCQ